MNLFAATFQHEKEPIGSQDWYATVVPLVQLHFPEGTVFPPSMTCDEFLQQIMSLPPSIRSQILNASITEQQEEIEKVKRGGYKNMLVAVVLVILIGAIIMTGGYVAATGFNGNSLDKEVLDSFFTFVFDLIKVMAATAGVQVGS